MRASTSLLGWVSLFALLLIESSASSEQQQRQQQLNLFQQGCLYHHNLTNHIRTCGSDDPPEFVENGICRPSSFEYPEVRIVVADWESITYETWIVQILLSELLGVPTSVETGSSTKQANFYDPNNEVDIDIPGEAVARPAIQKAYNLSGDCTLADRSSEDTYEACGHFYPELWRSQSKAVQDMVFDGTIQPVGALGMMGEEAWWVPKFTAQSDPSLLSYLGLQGPENQRKVAERFQKPITWGTYCLEYSTNRCATPDGVAQRAPKNDWEKHKFFLEGAYTGHFVKTHQNDCTLNANCKGYMRDYPCVWGSPVPAQLFWLNISLDHQLDEEPQDHDTSRTLRDSMDIWRAANATKSDVMFYWWTPDKFFLEFQGTDAEFIKVQMPAPTQACVRDRVSTADHCNPDLSIRHGSPNGVCEEPPNQVGSMMSTTVYLQSFAGEDKAVHSPAHTALSSFQITDLQIEEIFSLRRQYQDQRTAVCHWIVDNLDYMNTFVPKSYPRIVTQKDETTPVMLSSTIIGSFVALCIIIVAILVHENQDKRTIKYAQIEFLDCILLGSLLIAIGAVTIGVPSTSASCILEIWFVNLGYTLELAPLIVKTAGITHVIGSGKRMKRITISRQLLFGIVALIGFIGVVFLAVWTALDPPTVRPEYELTDDQEEDETLVWVLGVCRSESILWSYAAVGWNAGLLLFTSVYALKMRKIEMVGFNETSTLALMVYSHSVFVVLRVITYLLSSSVNDYILAHCRSLIFSVDTLASTCFYFLPKFLAQDDNDSSGRVFIRADSFHSLQSNVSLGRDMSMSSIGYETPQKRTSKEHVAAILRQQEEERAACKAKLSSQSLMSATPTVERYGLGNTVTTKCSEEEEELHDEDEGHEQEKEEADLDGTADEGEMEDGEDEEHQEDEFEEESDENLGESMGDISVLGPLPDLSERVIDDDDNNLMNDLHEPVMPSILEKIQSRRTFGRGSLRGQSDTFLQKMMSRRTTARSSLRAQSAPALVKIQSMRSSGMVVMKQNGNSKTSVHSKTSVRSSYSSPRKEDEDEDEDEEGGSMAEISVVGSLPDLSERVIEDDNYSSDFHEPVIPSLLERMQSKRTTARSSLRGKSDTFLQKMMSRRTTARSSPRAKSAPSLEKIKSRRSSGKAGMKKLGNSKTSIRSHSPPRSRLPQFHSNFSLGSHSPQRSIGNLVRGRSSLFKRNHLNMTSRWITVEVAEDDDDNDEDNDALSMGMSDLDNDQSSTTYYRRSAEGDPTVALLKQENEFLKQRLAAYERLNAEQQRRSKSMDLSSSQVWASTA